MMTTESPPAAARERADVAYRIDSRDVFVHLSDGWLDFATANDAPDLRPENVVGRPLWDFVADETTRQLYREILVRVRAGRVVSFPFRCDAPDSRRFMEMSVTTLGGGVVEFESTTRREEERDPPQPLLDREAPRAGDLLRICGWCKRVDAGGWREVEEAVAALRLFERRELPRLTHGMCDGCHRDVSERIAARRRGR